MNKDRRKQIAKAIALIEEAQEILENVKQEEQDAYDNLPENLQGSQTAQSMDEYIAVLEEYLSNTDTGELQEIVDS